MDASFPITAYYNYWVSIALMMVGFYILIVSGNLIKKLVGMAIFQTSALLLYISTGKLHGGRAPIVDMAAAAHDPAMYSHPLPHVLMLTAIVVGVATLAVGLAIAVRIKLAYGSIEEADILRQDREEQ